ncbi:presenilin-associated rhomboid-like protein A, mitochondrial [Eucyclogobius newberryi]|uniref:presenilin-associated rhomboid-like protein A, mitochondrial n=1 Tax=Eucyclogobius newberryi TaxID=166745 RepID=UPI003B59D447
MAWRGFIVRKLTKTEFIRSGNTTWSRYSLNPYQQQVRCFRREAKTKKSNNEQEMKVLPSENKTPTPPPKISRPSLFKPLLFTLGFTGCSFAAAAVLQYESLRSKVKAAKEESDDLSKGSHDMTYWHNWWNQLTAFQKQLILLMSTVDDLWSSLTEGQRIVTGIIAVNVVVLCCWRIPSMQRNMIKYFTANPVSKTQCLPMVLSTFSHYSIIHMMANMYVLWTFSSGLVSLLGKEQFLAFYLSAGVLASMVSYMCKSATRRFHPSLGASGAVMAVLAAVCTTVPEAKLGIIFLPMVTLSAGHVLKALVAFDTAGLFLGWRLFDHAAHLGGALFGVWYIADGHRLIWRRREPFVKLWHSLRSKATNDPRPGARPGTNRGER